MRHCAFQGKPIFAGAALVFTIYALGRYTPVFAWAFHFLPGVEQFRRPADGTFTIGAMGALASGALLNDWLDPAIRVRWVRLLVALACIGTAMLVVPSWVAVTHSHFEEALPGVVQSSLAGRCGAGPRSLSRPRRSPRSSTNGRMGVAPDPGRVHGRRSFVQQRTERKHSKAARDV